MSDLLYLLVTIVIGGSLIWAVYRIEPHWVSKDGRRFICRGQLMDDHGNTHGGWHEYRVRVSDDGDSPSIHASRRGLVHRNAGATWRVAARSTNPPRRKAVFLLHPVAGTDHMLALRLPDRSRAVPVLDGARTA